jgi:hypothetical protein
MLTQAQPLRDCRHTVSKARRIRRARQSRHPWLITYQPIPHGPCERCAERCAAKQHG